MNTKVIDKHNGIRSVSTTDPNDPDAVPAFETSAGIPSRGPKKPVMVNRAALENFNAQVAPAVAKNQLEAANVAALFSKRAIRPDEIAALRRRMFEVVADGLEDVDQVMKGTKQWSNVQVRLFSILTERVMPKLTTISLEDPSKKKLEDLSIEELEAIATGKKKHLAVDAVVKEGQQLEQAAERTESKDAQRKLKGNLIQIASLDEAEKLYVADKTKSEDTSVREARDAAKKPSGSAPTPTPTASSTWLEGLERAAASATSGQNKA
jgi:hypothetical protein